MEYIGYILIALGLFLVLSGSIGVLRFPDYFTRVHAAGVTDSMGAPLCILGVMFLEGWTIFSAKLLILIILLLLTSPTACHAISKAAFLDRNKPKK